MEDEADEEVQQWAAKTEVSDLLPKLSQAGFTTMQAVRLIAAKEDVQEIGVTRLGDILRLLWAVRQAGPGIHQLPYFLFLLALLTSKGFVCGGDSRWDGYCARCMPMIIGMEGIVSECI
jgi:hypothetical protein